LDRGGGLPPDTLALAAAARVAEAGDGRVVERDAVQDEAGRSGHHRAGLPQLLRCLAHRRGAEQALATDVRAGCASVRRRRWRRRGGGHGGLGLGLS
jgi:hypothetical protein